MKKITAFLLLLVLTALMAVPAYADPEEPMTYRAVSTYEDLLAIKEDPYGSYMLAADIDLKGREWNPLDFYGTFDGNGYAILNCTVSGVTADTRLSYDGNMISYDTVFSGFFGIVENATIKNLTLLGLKVDTHVEGDCFAGGMAGYTSETVIEDCTISGAVSLYVYGKMFGVGGAVGYGNGEVNRCVIDTTLICVDENVQEKDEQFMGGVNGNGYLSMDSCIVNIRGYVSEHGYAHNGGLSGMFQVYPEGNYYYGFITNNTVNGFISFFEDNEDRRAYCLEGIGEDMSETHDDYGNMYSFESDEHFEYDTNLLPEMCESPAYQANVVESTEDSFGYTVYTCPECGYSYSADYTLKKAPETTAQVTQETTEEITTPEITTVQTEKNTESVTETGTEEAGSRSGNSYIWPLVIAGVAAAAVMVVVLVKTFKK